MKVVAISFSLLLLASFAKSQHENLVDDFLMLDNMDSTLGILEKSFGESITQKLARIFIDVTQNLRCPMEVLAEFMQELSYDDVNSISSGIISITRGVADILELPGARQQLNLFIKMTPSVIGSLSSLLGGNQFGFGGGNRQDEPATNRIANVDDPSTSKLKDRSNVLERNAVEIADVTGDLLVAGMSLMGSLASGFLNSNSKGQERQNSGGIITNLVTNVIENLLESGALGKELVEIFEENDNGEDDEKIETVDVEQTEVNEKLEKPEDLNESKKMQPRSSRKQNYEEPNHQDL